MRTATRPPATRPLTADRSPADDADFGADLDDQHSVLLWQACAYADELTSTARTGRPLTGAHDAFLEFLHYRLLPYLADEERRLSTDRLRDRHMLQLLVTDHERLRADVENVTASRTRRLLALATDALIARLDRHVRREETWVTPGDPVAQDTARWALPLLLDERIDVDALPAEHRLELLRHRLGRMRPGETLRLDSQRDLHPVWRQLNPRLPGGYSWVYDDNGPARWCARISRRAAEER